MMSKEWRLIRMPVVPKVELAHSIVADLDTQIGIYSSLNRQWFMGLVVDEDENFTRRLFVPMTRLDIKALAAGAVSLRQLVMFSSGLVVIDYPADHESPLAWGVEGLVPADVVPASDSFLPPSLGNNLRRRFFTEREWMASAPCIYLSASASASQRPDAPPRISRVGAMLSSIGTAIEALAGTPVYAPEGGAGSHATFLQADNEYALKGALEIFGTIVNEAGRDSSATLNRQSRRAKAALRAFFSESAQSDTDALVWGAPHASFVMPRLSAHFTNSMAPLSRESARAEPEMEMITRQGRLKGLVAEGGDYFLLWATDERPFPRNFSGKLSPRLKALIRDQKRSYEVGYETDMPVSAVIKTPIVPYEISQKKKKALEKKTELVDLWLMSPTSKMERRFRPLAETWLAGTMFTSSMSERLEHPAYRQIVALGRDVVPVLLREMMTTPDHWGPALSEITGYVPPLSSEDNGRLSVIARAWLEWGKREGYEL